MKAAVWSCAALLVAGAAHAAEDSRPATLSQETKQCLQCHKEINTGMYQEWGESKHFGANVGCYECHKAEKGEKDAIDHNGFSISVIVSPKDCSRCHAKEVEEFEGSHHSKAG